jgi:hypothetical protein
MRVVLFAAVLALAPVRGTPQEPAAPKPEPSGAAEAPPASPGAAEPEEAAPPAGAEEGTVEGSGEAPRGEAPTAPDTYTVKPGDTLWDLSGRFLNNPWYWPKLWSYNPQITNPHWIQPGNVLRFYPATEEAPPRVEAVAEAPEEAPQAPEQLEDFSRAEMGKAPTYGEGDEVAVAGPYKIGYVAPRGTLGRRDTFVTAHQLQEAGTITAAFEDKGLLTVNDKIYGRFQDPSVVKVGQSYSLFRTERVIRHPRTGEKIGYQTVLLGRARAVAQDDDLATLVVTQASAPIERGDRIAPTAERVLKMVATQPNARRVEGFILATEREATWLAGESHVVFVDKGLADGVVDGNTFEVLRAGDPYGHDISEKTMAAPENLNLPLERIGTLLVTDAKEHVSTALVLKSLRELVAGDRVEMRPAEGRPTALR